MHSRTPIVANRGAADTAAGSVPGWTAGSAAAKHVLRVAIAAAVAVVSVVAVGVQPGRAEEAPDLAMLGARARAMGGAYVAVADDVDAVGWNPAGLAEIEDPELTAQTRLSFGSGAFTDGLDTFTTGGLAESPVLSMKDTPGTRFTYYLIGGAAPLPVKGRVEEYGLVAAASYRRVIDLYFRQEQLLQFDVGGGIVVPFEHVDDSTGGVDAFTLSFAGHVIPDLSLGLNVNFLTGFVEDVDRLQVAFEGTEVFTLEQRNRRSVDGHSFEFGARYEVLPELLPQVTVGGILRPGYDVDRKQGQGRFRQVTAAGGPLPPSNIFAEFPIPGITNEFPTTWGVGIAGVPRPGLTVAADFQYRPWNETVNVVHQLDGENDVEDPKLYEAHSFHLGGEYVFHRDQEVKVPVRLGFRTAPTPLSNADSLSAEVGPDGYRTFRGDRIEANTISGGVGIHFSTVGFDFAIDRTKTSFSEHSEFFAAPPLPGQPLRIVEVEETITNFYLSSTLRF
jgi:hypothetical protein